MNTKETNFDNNVVLRLGNELLLNIMVIYYNVDYLLITYKNDPMGTGFEWFEDLVLNILKNPCDITLHGFVGMPTCNDHDEKFVLYIKFIGDNLCTIPLQLYYNNNIPVIHECISEIIEFFIVKTVGLEGALILRGFKFNEILNTIFYPNIYIITFFRRYIEMIICAFRGDEVSISIIQKLLNIVKKILDLECYKSILDKKGLREDLMQLYDIIKDSKSLKELSLLVTNLWTTIAAKANLSYIFYSELLTSKKIG